MRNVVLERIRKGLHVAANVYWEYKPWWTPRRLTTSLDEIDIDRPIFILGVQGGGLTLLTRMIHRAEHIVTIGGGRAYWTGNNEMDKHYTGRLPDDFALRSPRYQSPTFKTHLTGEEDNHPVFGLERDWVYACDRLLDEYRKTEADWTAENEDRLRRAIKESIRAYASDVERARFLDMSQTFSLKVPLLREIFPDAHFVVQTRNPYAVCVRAAQDFRYEWVRELETARETKLLKLQITSEHWRNTFAYATGDLEGDEKATRLRYEDLVQDPEGELQRVLEAVDVPYDPNMIPRAHHCLPVGSSEPHKWFPIRGCTNDKYLQRLDANMASIIRDKVGGVAEAFGYHPPLDVAGEGRSQ
ncbi:sulfotransferase family protein [Salinibacter grassmerensis]|uniref:sulfotransferase family protein n=1 Tax=Salinibacter grassmerensis TaxID=3040353 RepID=UPI0021E90B22|nr:sulfotransferase [Salinibacter grassmerensis]